MRSSRYPGVYTDGKGFYTKSKFKESVYGERVLEIKGRFYRRWEPVRSKLSAAMHLHLENFHFKGSKILYLGASTGTTVSHLSDIAELVWAVEISPMSMQKLVHLGERRDNIVPILDDARYPEHYAIFVEKPNIIYQDVSQRDQVEIFLKNMEFYAPKFGYLMLKTRTIDVRKKPKEIMKEKARKIGELYSIEEIINISKYQKDHYAIVVRK
ncbi:fibrillarin-like rRNA/tRNA 2'-O-methyltransferase [Candidatus Aciduliprofundum boonei]|uniref:Fibrillarin-like rRNA/tRNA 2'-O-methyltransferase n=1 Tax=Aciduliprofundum boonei (strain DSM 19572 / T469) TaxID=439481 RepID=B5IEU0_ACIB4|nr:fibrillarin-like rRNA/tRNA 2'-O-methyltransferase [Candidatus Aciduliprofundum boonei]ADD07962.1 fibrillarin [Aciduliprofundum boonei T469]EDY35233.1 Fibrillarin superfamily [Aciduliprofundum boonei T469]HII55169.1 fibrillarin-like rRNA/tRNA 2'-O-methyltransferase [Candidatus Aciduliprofundum boonei]